MGGHGATLGPTPAALAAGRARARWFSAARTLGFRGSTGAVIVAVVLLIALLGARITPYGPLDVDMLAKLQPPGAQHWFGTDELGRDVFSRTLAGARLSLLAAFVVLAIGVTAGAILGALAGYYGGRLDNAIMRLTDVFLAFPPLLLAIVVSAALGPSLLNAAIAIGIVWWPGYARLARGEFLSLRQRGFVEAARSIGGGSLHIIVRHIAPNAVSPILVKTTVDVGYAILLTSSLSFIGLGAQPPLPEWGAMVTSGRNYLLNYWWYSTYPGMAIGLTVLGFTVLGDAIRDILDPMLRGGGL